ncbi:hypothetical protein SISNIDRAFT_467286 [Sistotremastrum niveocremeum HHB9708]|uniref:DUF6535 domain-containing protein n=1 Tax=Sistotremastrum niveocremeum HHB9708 TaxID=1314777 RepID=A0A164T3Y4_9AGAM|nr:hypothetical protein SISNIDRAFT_467286 [Sistotremastrum niveocremeum HHB9708]
MADPDSHASSQAIPTAPAGDLTSIFAEMVQLMRGQSEVVHLMKRQNELMEEQGKTLREHSTKLDTLTRDALKDDQAYERKDFRDRLTWNVLGKEAWLKTKEKVDGWRDLMQISLVFIAIFLTVVTAFITPVIQTFTSPATPSSGDQSTKSSKPPLPPLSTQFIALFFYLALIVSWAGRLLAILYGKDDFERTMAHERRKALAEKKLIPLMGVLFWTLLLSIGFFIIGLLIQLWALAFSCDEPASTIIVGAVLATALSVAILGVIIATTYHAAVTENSPFESPLSAAMRPALQWFRSRSWGQPDAKASGGAIGGSEHPETKLTVDDLVKARDDENENVEALKTYARLVLNTNDAEVLERAVPSFEIGEWCKSGGELLPVFLAVRDRFLATDTSFRVKETVKKQLVYCRRWSGWRNGIGWRRSDFEGNAVTRWCRDQCNHLTRQSHEYHRQFFSSFVFFASLDPHNKDLRGDPNDSYQETIVRVLSSFDRDGKLGERYRVFESAVRGCKFLLRDGRSDDVTRILSCGDRSSLLRSLLRNPHTVWAYIKDIVALITRGNEVAVLEELAKFFSNLPDIYPVFNGLFVLDFLGSLIPSLSSTFTVPQSFDLAPTLSLLLLHQSDIESSLSEYSEILLYVLDHGGFAALSSLRPAYDFFQLCFTLSSYDDIRDTKIQDRARFYLGHEAFVALPPPSPEELQHLIDVLQSYQDNMASEDSEKNFIDAVIECDYVCREGNEAEIKGLLSHVDCVALLGQQIWSLIPVIIEANDLECISAAPALLANIPLVARFDGDLPILAFLTSLISFLPPGYIVPPRFDLSQTLALFMLNDPDRQTWRKHSETLMHYLHAGAFDALSNQDSVRRFLDICADPSYWWMRDWSQDQRTSILTRERAIELQKKIDALEAVPTPVIATPPVNAPDPPSHAEEIEPQSLTTAGRFLEMEMERSDSGSGSGCRDGYSGWEANAISDPNIRSLRSEILQLFELVIIHKCFSRSRDLASVTACSHFFANAENFLELVRPVKMVEVKVEDPGIRSLRKTFDDGRLPGKSGWKTRRDSSQIRLVPTTRSDWRKWRPIGSRAQGKGLDKKAEQEQHGM